VAVTLDDERRGHMVGRLRGFFLEEFDEDLSAFRAESLLDFFLDDLDAEIHEPEAR
jgi:uncharacterized protein (DUF2164 family)